MELGQQEIAVATAAVAPFLIRLIRPWLENRFPKWAPIIIAILIGAAGQAAGDAAGVGEASGVLAIASGLSSVGAYKLAEKLRTPLEKMRPKEKFEPLLFPR